MEASNNSKTKFYLYYHSNRSVREVSRKTFSTVNGKVFSFRDFKIKAIVTLKDKATMTEVKEVLKGFKPQTNVIWQGFKGLLLLGNVTSKISQVVEQVSSESKRLIMDLVSVLLDLCRLVKGKFAVIDLISSLVSLYRVWSTVEEVFVPQSMDALVFSSLSLFLPKPLFEIIKRMNTFSNLKFLDDPSLFHNFLLLVIDYLEKFLIYIKMDHLWTNLKHCFEMLRDKVVYIKLKKLHDLSIKIMNDKSLSMSVSVRSQFQKSVSEMCENVSLMEWAKRSATISNYIRDIENVSKMLKSYDNSFRIEPTCIIMEGPPGTLKSVFMNGVIESLGETCYYHNIKAAMDGKDWYDNYNNETVFSMDDVGAQGISQWRTIVNLVSPIKLPLDCAEAAKKDTKYFSSELIILTTNAFSDLHGVTKSDCITDIRALWRRGYVFEYNTTRAGNMLNGMIQFKYFDVLENAFIYRFPPDMLEFIRSKNININNSIVLTVNDVDQKSTILSWMLSVINIIRAVKKLQKNDNAIDVAKIRSMCSFIPNSKVEDDISEYFDDDEYDDVLDYRKFDSYKRSEPSTHNAYQDIPASKDTYWESILEYLDSIMQGVEDKIGVKTATSCLLGTALLSAVLGVVYYIIKSRNPKSPTFEVQSDLHPTISAIAKATYEADFCIKENGAVVIKQNTVLVSGHNIVTVAHPFIKAEGPIQVTIYKNRAMNSILVDKLFYDIVFSSRSEDVCVLSCIKTIASPFKNLSKHFKTKQSRDIISNAYIVNQEGCVKLCTIRSACTLPVVYKTQDVLFAPKEVVKYSMQGIGMCGSVIVDSFDGVLGMHVAGNKSNNTGAAVLWSDSVKDTIRDILLSDSKFLLDVDISDRVYPNFSGIKLDKKMYLNTPKETSLAPTQLQGIFENHRIPSELSKYGKHTVKTVAKKSFQPLKVVDFEELEFASKVLKVIIPSFDEISEEEVVKGNEFLAPLNKDSSNGFGCAKEKDVYIDFENGCLTERCRREIQQIENEIENGVVDVNKFIWAESLKDEVRDVSKEGEPRSFRVGTIHTQILTKFLTGDLVSKIIRSRDFHGIALGVNPIIEWPKYYTKLLRCGGKHWASDVKKWDGSMLSQVQQIVNDVVLEKYQGKRRVLLSFYLSSLIYCLVGMNDDLYMTNHSFPSGSFWTALFNSLVNKAYTAMWYFRVKKAQGLEPKVSGFFSEVFDVVLGDDKLIGVYSSDSNLNALTMNDFFVSIGLDTTTARKTPITEKYDKMEELTFLKRGFEYHPILRKIVCPLDIKTIVSTIQWYDTKKEYDDVVRDKLHCFQREAFLHWNSYYDLVYTLSEECRKRGVALEVLPLEYLTHLYLNEPELLKLMSYSNFKYN